MSAQISSRPDRDRSLQNPQRAHRQRGPLHHARQSLSGRGGELIRAHAFEFACAKADIGHRLTKPNHPWTNGQVERMNRSLKKATVKRFFYETHELQRRHLKDFVNAYNFARRLKTLRGLTPYGYICSNPTHLRDET